MAIVNTKYLLKKIAESVDMSFDIPEAEREMAADTIVKFEAAGKALEEATEHLKIIYDPFKRHKKISTKAVVKRRGVLNRFKQASVDKFNTFKKRAFVAIRKLDYFSSGDSDIQELINAFESSVGELEDELENFYEALSDYENTKFRDNILSTIDKLRNASEDTSELIYDRVIDHIESELIAKTWLSETKKQLKVDDQPERSFISELFRERQDILNGMPATNKDPQALNMSDAQKIHYPDSIRTMNIGEFGE